MWDVNLSAASSGLMMSLTVNVLVTQSVNILNSALQPDPPPHRRPVTAWVISFPWCHSGITVSSPVSQKLDELIKTLSDELWTHRGRTNNMQSKSSLRASRESRLWRAGLRCSGPPVTHYAASWPCRVITASRHRPTEFYPPVTVKQCPSSSCEALLLVLPSLANVSWQHRPCVPWEFVFCNPFR